MKHTMGLCLAMRKLTSDAISVEKYFALSSLPNLARYYANIYKIKVDMIKQLKFI